MLAFLVLVYHDAKWQLNEYVREKLKSISGVDGASKIEVVGLSDFLSIPEELLDDEESVPGLADSSREGISSENKTEDETGLVTTFNTIIKVKTSASSISAVAAGAVAGEGDDIVIKGGGLKNDDSNPNPDISVKPGDDIEEGDSSTSGEVKSYIPVRFRAAAGRDQFGIIHSLIINSDQDYFDVSIDIKTGTDNGEDADLNILEVDHGSANQSKISGLNLTQGKNIIKVRFDDGIKHTLKLTAYEAQ